jgi:glycosyltransferase involved in cell wall biosynthesis
VSDSLRGRPGRSTTERETDGGTPGWGTVPGGTADSGPHGDPGRGSEPGASGARGDTDGGHAESDQGSLSPEATARAAANGQTETGQRLSARAERGTTGGSGETATRPVRLWFLITALSVGGAERTLVDLANSLDRDRYDVTVWTMFDRNPLAADLDPAIPVRSLGSPGHTRSERGDFVEKPGLLDYVGIPLRFFRAVRRERPDVIQSFLFNDNTLARLAGLLSPSTTVVTGVRGMQHIESAVVRTVDRLTIPLSDRIVSNSAAGAAHVRRRGARADRIAVVHNGRDLWAYADADPAPLRETFAIPTDAPLVGTVGRLVERKGGYDLLAAWPTVREALPSAHLVLVGDGVERASLEARADELGVAGSVHFAGTRDDVPAVLAAVDCFVFPSHYEGLPGALLEAMAAGCPIVATDIEGNDELVTDGRTGLLVPVEDPAGLAAGLTRLLTDETLANRLGEAAQSTAFERFSLDAMVGNFERFYETL